MIKVEAELPETTAELRQRIARTFDVADLQSLACLIEVLDEIGQRSTATLLERLLEEDGCVTRSQASKENLSKNKPS